MKSERFPQLKTWTLPLPNIPASYRKLFVFTSDDGKFQQRILIAEQKLTANLTGKAGPKTSSLCLDWMQEAMEQVRHDTGIEGPLA